VLQQLGIIRLGATRTAGSSAGALAQGVDHFPTLPHERFVSEAARFAVSCRASRNCLHTLDAQLALLVARLVPPGAARLASGRACGVVSLCAAPAGGAGAA
jgi:hypothetical protein